MSQPTSESISCASPYGSRSAKQTDWFAQEVHAHDSRLKSYLRGTFPSVRDIDDVVQESYSRVWRRHLARPITSARAFLFQVARHLAIDVLRRDRSSPMEGVVDFAGLSVMEDRPDAAETACTNEELDLLHAAIDTLPARCREIVILRKIQGLPQKVIARQLGLSESTVQVQASRGLRRCAEFMRAHILNGSVKS